VPSGKMMIQSPSAKALLALLDHLRNGRVASLAVDGTGMPAADAPADDRNHSTRV